MLALEISPLTERHHTGIANVTRAIAQQLFADESVDGRFFINRSELPRDLVRHALDLEDGEALWWVAGRVEGHAQTPNDLDSPAIGIYPGHKWHRRLYPTEVLIVHDVTTLLEPDFHTEDAVTFWQSQHLGDMLTSDLIVAVSESTKMDIRTYYPQVAHLPCIVALEGVAHTTSNVPEGTNVEPYVLVLGTLEPRKNVEVMFACLAQNPELLTKARFVFTGRWGWVVDVQSLIGKYGLERAVKDGRILLTGFVRDSVRDNLVRHARCVVYVTLYEGFGLPVTEALSVGTPVLTGRGSSLTEAGGDAAFYCDVSDANAVGRALCEILSSADVQSAAARARRQAWASQFAWPATYRTVRDAAVSLATRR